MTLTDKQVSMLLSEAEAGWPRGKIGLFEFAADVPRDSCLAETHRPLTDVYSASSGWHRTDAAKGRDAAGRLLAVLRRHGLVRCGECDGAGTYVLIDGYGYEVGECTCPECGGTGRAS